MSKKEEVAVAAVSAPRPLKPEILELSAKIITGLTLNKGDGVITESVKNFDTLMPEGITPDTDKAHSDYRKNFTAASLHAAGTITADALAKNKKLDTVTAELEMGDDRVRHAFERTKTFTYGAGADRQATTKIGVSRTEIDIKGGHNSGQLKIARRLVAEIITEKLGSK